MRKIISILFFFFVIFNVTYAQIVPKSGQLVSMKFRKNKIEANGNESFFNILTIKNNSDFTFSGIIKYTQPADWTIIGNKEINVSVNANDSINLPIRVIVSNKVFGEIAYAIVAGLFDSNNRPIISEYCFVNIPRISDLTIKAPNKIIYFDNKTQIANFKYTLSNNGNTNEIVQLNLKANEYLSVENNTLDNDFAYEYIIPPHTDTIIDVDVKLKEKNSRNDFYQMNVSCFSHDSIYKNKIWFNKINNIYNHKIPESNKCAIVELTANDILSSGKTQYSLMAKGTFLLKNNSDIYYYFRKNNLEEDWDNYYSTRAFIGYKTKNVNLKVGTMDNIFQQYSYGIGGKIDLNYNQLSAQSFYVQNDNLQQSFYGGKFRFPVLKTLKLELGYAKNDIELNKNYTQLLLSGISFQFFKKNRISITSYINKTTYALYTPFEKIGYAILSKYSGSFNDFKIGIDVNYGTPESSGTSKGKFLISSHISYNLKQGVLFFNYNKNDNINSFYVNDTLQPSSIRLYDEYRISYNTPINSSINILSGLIYKLEGFNNPYIELNTDTLFKTINSRFFISSNIRLGNSSTFISPKIDIGNIKAIEALELDNSTNMDYFTYNIYVNINSANYNVHIQYRNGPLNIYEQYYYHNIEYFSRWLYILPSYHKYFFNDKLKFEFRASYRNNINTKESSFTLTPQIFIFFGKEWTLRFLNSNSVRTSRDYLTGANLRYNSTYFEAAIRKEFNCKQPRFQYHNLKVIFFKDLNGNRKKEKNEPGLRNVLTSIEPDYEIENSKVIKDFISQKFLTASDGNIEYTNIVNGHYKLKYVLIGDMVGNFNREELEQDIVIEKDETIYIPYLENNRIVGKVILNRNPLSRLGEIDVSNIRVVAKDTDDRSYSALTNKQGDFVLYTPVTNHYIVKINNIFYESFDLQQPEYVVKFNGYKQFEVTFVFNEKKQKVNFENDTEDNLKLDDLQVIQKTTLTGKIRDAKDLKPIEAKVKIIDNNTGKVISNSISNNRNGNYAISYVAGDHFRIEVTAKGYEKRVENLYIEQVISIQNINKNMMMMKPSTENNDNDKTFILYNEKEEKDFTQNFKSGQKIPINNLNFDEKQTRLKPNVYPELDRLIVLLNKNKNVNIEIAGHADDTDRDRLDKMLALRRAKAVEKYLITHGLSVSRVEVKSYSNRQPLIPGKSEKARQKNRRVEIIVQ